MESLLHDVRSGLRAMARAPRLTFAALLCTALGIGSAVFMVTLSNAVLLRLPPFPDAERLVRVRLLTRDGGGQGDLSYLELGDLRDQAKSFDGLEGAARTRMPVTSAMGTERVRGEAVTPGYFDLIAAKPSRGRLFTAGEYAPGADLVILVGDALWKRRFGGDPDIVGKPLRVRGRDAGASDRIYTIVGVMPPGFAGTVDYDVSEYWMPLEQTPLRPMFGERDARNIWTLARLAPGTGFPAARDEIAAIGRRLGDAHPGIYDNLDLRLEQFGGTWRQRPRTGLLTLTVAAGLLLLIGCTNIASLLLARLARREHELTMRLVLGAQRGRVFRQLLVESLLLSLAGGLAGILLAFWGVKLFASAKLIALPGYVELAPDLRVIALAVGLVVATGMLFGVLPALFGARADATRLPQGAGRTTSLSPRQRFWGQALVVLEVSFTFVLVIGAMLMVRTYRNLSRGDLGFRTEHVLRMAISLDHREYPEREDWLGFARRAKETIGRQPGVRGVALMNGTLPPWSASALDMALDGVPHEALRQVSRHAIDQDFLSVLDIDLEWGRAFGPGDRHDTPRVALVNASLARFVAGGPDPRGALGRRFQFVASPEPLDLSPPYEIVGVVEDVLYRGPRPLVADSHHEFDTYVPLEQFPDPTLSIAIVTDGDPARWNQPLQRELGRLAPTSPLHWISTMEDELALQYGDVRFYAWLTFGYSTCALLLAAFGIYSVLANSVTRRVAELGIRIAVGAGRGDILRLVVGQGMRTLLLGLLVGAGIALAGTSLVGSLLYGVAPDDPLTYAAVTALLIAIGLAACSLPARRAMRIDPATVLRNG